MKTLTQNSHLTNRKSNISNFHSMSDSGTEANFKVDPMIKAIKFVF